MKEKLNNTRNVTLTRYHPSCRLCSQAGFSNNCTFSRTGVYPYSAPAEGGRIAEVEQDD
jgi:hypothetical protein